MYPTKKLSEILEIIRNGKSCKQTSDKIGDKITRIETISFGEINEDKVGYFNLTNDEKIKYQIDKGDILFSHINSVEHIGKIAIAKKNYSDLFHGMNLLLLRGNKKDISDEYLYITLQFYFKSGYWAKICNKAINQASLNQKNIIDIDIPLPPLPTQKLIVQKLDSAFENIDKNINLTKENLKNLEDLNKSVLEKVFSEGEYEMKTIDEISENVQYGYTGKTIEKGQVKYLRITDIQDNKIIWNDVPYVKIDENEISKYSLNEGDIVFARTGATVGKSCLIDKNGVGNIFASYLIRIVGKKEIINPNFMQYFFYSKNYWEQIGFDVVGAAQPNFNGTKLKQIQIPLPPLQKQKEIVSYLDEVFAKNKQLKTKYELQLKELEELKQSLLKDAFEGRLVKE